MDAELENIAENYEWLMKVSSVMAMGEVTRNGMIEVKRFMKVIEFVNSNLEINDVVSLAHATYAYFWDEEKKATCIYHYKFLVAIRNFYGPKQIFETEDRFNTWTEPREEVAVPDQPEITHEEVEHEMELKPAEALNSSATSENHKIKDHESKIDAHTKRLMTKELMESKIRGYSGR